MEEHQESKKNFMKPTFQDPFKKREDFAVSLRKQKVAEIINSKRRRMHELSSQMSAPEMEFSQQTLNQMQEIRFPTFNSQIGSLENIKSIIDYYYSNIETFNLEMKRNVYDTLKKQSCGNQEIPISEIIHETRVLQFLSEGLALQDNDIALLCFWILSNFSVAEQEDVDILLSPEFNFLGFAETYLRTTFDERLFDNIVWFLSNLADTDRNRKLISKDTQIIYYLTQWLKRGLKNPSALNVLMWFGANFTRDNKKISQSDLLQLEFIAMHGISDDDTKSSLYEALDIYCQITSFDNEEVHKTILNSSLIEICVKLADSKNQKANSKAVRVLGNIISYPVGTQALDLALHYGLFTVFRNIMCEPNSQKVKEVLWTLSNILAAGPQYVTYFLQDEYLYHRVKLLTNNHNVDIKKEALFCVMYVVTMADHETVVNISTDLEIIQILSSALERFALISQPRLIIQIFEAIEVLLKIDSHQPFRTRTMAEKFVNQNIFQGLNKAQMNSNMEVYDWSVTILERYFQEDEQHMDVQVGFSI